MMEQGVILLIQLVLRIIGIFVCYNNAKELNRSKVGWALFGFFSPILAMIWIQFMKPAMVWVREPDINKPKKPKV